MDNGSEPKPLLLALSDPLEAYFLYSHIAAKLSEDLYPAAISQLQKGLQDFKKSSCYPEALNLLGILFYKSTNYDKAEETFQKLYSEWPESLLAPTALYYISKCAEKLQRDQSFIRSCKEEILKKYPFSPIAPEAYFTLFSYQEYLQGERSAIKHLNAFPELYPESPFILNAFFLIGLDNKRERRSSEGRWLRKKNLTLAIDNFQDVETYFEKLLSSHKIPNDLMEHYLLIRYRSHLERGTTNFTLSNESSRAKKQVYLQFAQEALQQLLKELNDEGNPHKKWMLHQDSFWRLEEEGAYWLSQAYIAANSPKEAEQILSNMLEKYKSAKITRGYFLSRAWSH